MGIVSVGSEKMDMGSVNRDFFFFFFFEIPA